MRANNRAQVVWFFVFVFFWTITNTKTGERAPFQGCNELCAFNKKNSITERISAAAGGCTSLGYKGQMKRPTLH